MSIAEKSTFATLPRTERGQPIVLGADPKGKTFLYCNGNSVIIRDVENPSKCDIYTQHSKETVVAKYAPSGFYIASGDKSGKIRIWDTVNTEHILKCEFQPLGGAMKDIAWSQDSQRIVVVGEGREKFGSVFMWDSGNTVGDIIGHSKSINSVDFKQTRPFRIVTASEDQACAFFEGPPFKFKLTLRDHSNFVNCVRYTPDGNKFISGGADGKLFVYDGKTAEKIGELGSPAHKGGIYAICFGPDGSKLLSVSGDKTAKLWDVENSTLLTEFVMGSAVQDMQVGCLFVGEQMLTVSLSGYINYLDPSNPSSPSKILKGHNKPITAMTLSEDRATVFTGSSDGHINYWSVDGAVNDEMEGQGHTNQVQDMVINGDTLITIGMDDTLRFSSASGKKYGTEQLKMDSQPRAVAVHGNTIAVACINHVVVLQNQRQTFSGPAKWEPLSVDIHPGGTEVAVGGGRDGKVHICTLNSGTLVESRVLETTGSITDVKFSPDGAFLATASADRYLRIFSLPAYEEVMNSTGHTARVTSVAWSPDSRLLASGSLDSFIRVWKPQGGYQDKVDFKAHPLSHPNRIAWVDDHTVVTAGQDSTVRQFTVTA